MPRAHRRSENDSDTSIDNNPVAGMEGYSSGFLELQTDDGGPRDRPRSAEKKGKTRKAKDATSTRGKVRKGSKTKLKRAPPEEDDMDDITVSMSLRDESPQRFPSQAVPRDDADRYYLRSPAPAELSRDPAAKAAREEEARARPVVPRAMRLSHSSPSRQEAPPLRPEPAAPPHAIPHLSPWLNERLAGGDPKRDRVAKGQKRNTVTDTGDLDTGQQEEIRKLQEKVDDLACENKLKDRELETQRWIQKELERKVVDAEDVFQVKSQLRETERQLDLLRQINRDQKDENQKLQQDIANKERHVLELQSEVDNLDKVISVKSSLRESDTIQELQERLDRTQVDLDRAAHEANAKDRQISYYQNEVEKRDREMQHKNRRIDDLQMEVEDMRDMVAVKNRQANEAAEKAKAAEREAQAMQDEANRSNDLKVQLQDARDEIGALQERCNELEGEVESLRRQQESQQDLQSVVDDLRQVVSENNLAEKERQQMGDQLRRTEGLLKERESTPRRMDEPFHRSTAAPQETSPELWPPGAAGDGAMPRDELAELVRLNSRSPRDRESLARSKRVRRKSDAESVGKASRDSRLSVKRHPRDMPERRSSRQLPCTSIHSIPDPPRDVKILRVLSRRSLLLRWTPPEIGRDGRHHGLRLEGYKISVDGKEAETLPDPKQTRCLLENIAVRPNSVLAVETLAEGGRTSDQTRVFIPEEEIPSVEDEEAIKAWSDREMQSEGGRSPSRSPERRPKSGERRPKDALRRNMDEEASIPADGDPIYSDQLPDDLKDLLSAPPRKRDAREGRPNDSAPRRSSRPSERSPDQGSVSPQRARPDQSQRQPRSRSPRPGAPKDDDGLNSDPVRKQRPKDAKPSGPRPKAELSPDARKRPGAFAWPHEADNCGPSKESQRPKRNSSEFQKEPKSKIEPQKHRQDQHSPTRNREEPTPRSRRNDPREPSPRGKNSRDPREPSPRSKGNKDPREPSPLSKAKTDPRPPSSRSKSRNDPRESSPMSKAKTDPQKPSSRSKSRNDPRESSPMSKASKDPQKPSSKTKDNNNLRQLSPKSKGKNDPREPSPKSRNSRDPREPSPKSRDYRDPREPSPKSRNSRDPREPSPKSRDYSNPRDPSPEYRDYSNPRDPSPEYRDYSNPRDPSPEYRDYRDPRDPSPEYRDHRDPRDPSPEYRDYPNSRDPSPEYRDYPNPRDPSPEYRDYRDPRDLSPRREDDMEPQHQPSLLRQPKAEELWEPEEYYPNNKEPWESEPEPEPEPEPEQELWQPWEPQPQPRKGTPKSDSKPPPPWDSGRDSFDPHQNGFPEEEEFPPYEKASTTQKEKDFDEDVFKPRSALTLNDYKPSDNSPSRFPNYELSFKKGQNLRIYGPRRPDGFYNAEVDSRRGLVPESYVLED